MSRRAITVTVGAVVVGAAVLVGLRVTVDENGATGSASKSSGSFAAQTEWGTPNLAGVWKGVPLGAGSGGDTFDLTTLEGLYTPEARARMTGLSAEDDPTMRCAPPAFPRAAMLGHAIQIIQSPGFAFIFTEAYPVFRTIPTNASTGIWLSSDAMHVVEQWRRIDVDTLEYQARVEDPTMLTSPWQTPTVTFKRQSVARIEEFFCRPEDGPATYLSRIG